MAEYFYNLQEKPIEPVNVREDIQKNWPWAVLSYMGLLFLIPFAVKKESPFAVYHAKQSLTIFILAILWFAVWFVLNKIIPEGEFMFLLTTGIGLFGFMTLFIMWLSGIVNAFNGEAKPALFLQYLFRV